jgi:hypothetical protein
VIIDSSQLSAIATGGAKLFKFGHPARCKERVTVLVNGHSDDCLSARTKSVESRCGAVV